jgi:ribonuclease P protein component
MSREARAEGLSRRHRFTGQGSFGLILGNSRKLRGPHAVVHVSPGTPGASRLGITVTRRLFRSSLERNRVKRAMRELFRRHPLKRSGLDVVISFRTSVDARDPALLQEIRTLLDQAEAQRS